MQDNEPILDGVIMAFDFHGDTTYPVSHRRHQICLWAEYRLRTSVYATQSGRFGND